MKITRRNRPVVITDAPEHRAIPLDRVEIREDDGDDNEYVLEGYASTFEEYEMYGGPANYGWIERIDPGAFEKTLREKPDLHLLINLAGMPLARTKSGTLDLSVDDRGLKVVARLDKRDPEVQSLAVKMSRGDMDEMSFAFRVKAQEWRAAEGFEEDDQSYRTIKEVSLHKGDVSVVNWGANPTTSAGIRSLPEAIETLGRASVEDLKAMRTEIRGEGSDDLLIRAAQALTGLVASEPSADECEGVEDITEERTCATCTCPKADEEVEETEDEGPVEETPTVIAEEAKETERAADEEHPEECSCEGCEDEEEEMSEDEPRGMTLADALADQGIMPETEKLSLAAALALAK